MADVFISYSQQSTELTQKLVNELKSRGLNVWWDANLRNGERFDDEIRKQLDDAQAVIVIWSATAAKSKYVLMEAGIAFAWEKLITLRDPKLPTESLPEPFKGHQTGVVTEIDKVMEALEQKGVQAKALGAGRKLSREEIFARLNDVDPSLPARLEAWLGKCQKAGFRVSTNRSLMLKTNIQGVGDVNYGTLFPDGKVQTNYISETAARAGDPAIAADYLDGLALMIDGASVRKDGTPWNWRVDVYGDLPKLSQLLDHGDRWLELMIATRQRFLARAK